MTDIPIIEREILKTTLMFKPGKSSLCYDRKFKQKPGYAPFNNIHYGLQSPEPAEPRYAMLLHLGWRLRYGRQLYVSKEMEDRLTILAKKATAPFSLVLDDDVMVLRRPWTDPYRPSLAERPPFFMIRVDYRGDYFTVGAAYANHPLGLQGYAMACAAECGNLLHRWVTKYYRQWKPS